MYMERVARIELAIKLWQSFRLPLHHTRIFLFIKTGYLLCDGLKAVALPLSDFSIRKKLESNQRVINDVAASILKLAEAVRFELTGRFRVRQFSRLLQ